MKELNDRDRGEIARSIKEEFTSGILDDEGEEGDEENTAKRITWRLDVEIH